jgi:predicted N-acetyltransferase YhbS
VTTPLRYALGNDLDIDQVLELYVTSTLGARRPIEDRDRFAAMVKNANLTVTAWEDELLVGIARSVTDFAYVAYLSDLAVRVSHQQRGIGTELIRRTRAELHPKASLLLLSAPAAVEYYPKIGFRRHPEAWLLEADAPLGKKPV